MRRPEKKDEFYYYEGYNLPTVEELEEIMTEATEKHYKQVNNDWDIEFAQVSARAIHKRLRGES